MTQNKPAKLTIGVTGNSGSGKTTVTNLLVTCGGYAIDADITAHKVMAQGQPAYKKIISAFGSKILEQSSQEISRKKLGAIVFNDIEKRTQLESIVHPLISDKIIAEIKTATESIAHSFIIIDAVLLVESGMHHFCNSLWLITAIPENRLARIIVRDNLSQEMAESRMRNQRDTTTIANIAQVIIHNDRDIKTLEAQVKTELKATQRDNQLC
ncbi:MAG: dephospho-CoA kinase [Defluviitaleaceae bacterium]|nr:dephospho-CoA kinase [Defluviitaleaceae bacterium]